MTVAPFTIPDIEAAPLFHAQAVPDTVDLGLLSGWSTGVGWVSGCAVTPTAVPSYAVAVATGTVYIAGTSVAVAAAASLAPTSPSTGDRRDIVLVGTNGVPYIKAGTPSTVAGWTVGSIYMPPVKPAADPDTVVLAELYIVGNDPGQVLVAGAIVDKRAPTSMVTAAALWTEGDPVFHVKAYGAVGDGVTDDRAAIQQAIADAKASGGGVIYAPRGTYRIASGALDISGLVNVTFQGAGWGTSLELPAGLTGTQYLVSGSGAIAGVTFADLDLNVAYTTGTWSTVLVSAGTCASLHFRNVRFRGQGWGGAGSQPYFANIAGNAAGAVTDLVFDGCRFENDQPASYLISGIIARGVTGMAVRDCTFVDVNNPIVPDNVYQKAGLVYADNTELYTVSHTTFPAEGPDLMGWEGIAYTGNVQRTLVAQPGTADVGGVLIDTHLGLVTSDVVITGNVFVQNPIQLAPQNGAPILGCLIDGNRVAGNRSNNGVNCAILLGGPDAGTSQRIVIGTNDLEGTYTGAAIIVGSGYAAGAVDFRDGLSVKLFGATGNGTADDQPAIQAALTVAAATGGRVIVPAGTYRLATAPQSGPAATAYCLLLSSHVLLDLHPGATLALANGLNAGVVLVATSATGCGVVGKGVIDGNKANQVDGGVDGGQAGIYGTALTYYRFDVTIQNCIRQGAYISNSSWGEARIVAISNGTTGNSCAGVEDDAGNDSDFDVRALYNGGAGFHMVGGAGLADNKVRARVIAYGNQYGVFGLYAQGSRLIGCICQANTGDGIILEHCDGVVIDGAYADGNTRHGIYDYLGSNNTIAAPTCRNNNHGGASGGVGINLYGTVNAVVSAPRCYDDQGTTTQVYGIQTDSTATGTVTGGSMLGYGTGAAASIGGTGVLFRHVDGVNPHGAVAVTPSTGVALGPYPYDTVHYITAASGAAVTCAVQGGSSPVVPAGTMGTVRLPAGKTLTPTFGTAPSAWLADGE